MNRNDEYKDLIEELSETPPALEYTVARARARVRKNRIVRRSFLVPVGSAAAFLICFTVLVNVSMPFAMACERIPILRELAVAVAFSPSLSTAVENEFVQLIGQEQRQNDITMKVEYVIVDQKQLNVFFTLNSPVYPSMEVTPEIMGVDGTSFGGYSIVTWGIDDNDALRHILVDFHEGDVPAELVLICKVSEKSSSGTSEAPVQSDMFSPVEYSEPNYIAAFEFVLSFDPYFTHQSETIVLNQTFILDGQRLTVTTVEIYPTHARLNLEDHPSNTAWLKSLGFYFENEKGVRFETINNGISATGSPDSPMMRSHRLESSFFADSKRLTLYITDVVWLDIDMERVRVDLENVAADVLPQGVAFEHAARGANSWELVFSGAESRDNHMYQLFGWEYFDEDGNAYEYNSVSSGTIGSYVEREGVFFVQFALAGYTYDTVYLSPSFSRMTYLDQPVAIGLK